MNVPFHFVEQSLKTQRTGNDRDYLNGKKDIHENDLNFQRKVYEEYLNMLEEQDQFIAINCMSSEGKWLEREKIHQAIKIIFEL